VVTQRYGPAVQWQVSAWFYDIRRLEKDAQDLQALGWQAFAEQRTSEGHELYARAYRIYRRTAELGSNDALIQLGLLNCAGWGVKANASMAREFLSKASLDLYALERIHAVEKLSNCRWRV
jgi:TPR repeat protein